jgi:hypothetical protein
MTYAVNVLAPFLLTALLLDKARLPPPLLGAAGPLVRPAGCCLAARSGVSLGGGVGEKASGGAFSLTCKCTHTQYTHTVTHAHARARTPRDSPTHLASPGR